MTGNSGAVRVGDVAPEFTLPSLRGTQVGLSSYQGKQHVVLWFSRGFTCNFCHNYMQSVIDDYPAMQAAGIEVIQVAPNLLDSARSYFEAGTPVPSQQFQTLADHVPVVLDCDYLAICLIVPDGKGYLIHSLLGLAGGAVPERPFRLDEGVPGQVMAHFVGQSGRPENVWSKLGRDYRANIVGC